MTNTGRVCCLIPDLSQTPPPNSSSSAPYSADPIRLDTSFIFTCRRHWAAYTILRSEPFPLKLCRMSSSICSNRRENGSQPGFVSFVSNLFHAFLIADFFLHCNRILLMTKWVVWMSLLLFFLEYSVSFGSVVQVISSSEPFPSIIPLVISSIQWFWLLFFPVTSV